MAAYIALIRKERGSVFGVEFPDFPGCISAGDSLDEAVANAKEALELHIEGLLQDGEAIPEPSGLELIRARHGEEGAVPVLIEVPVVRRKRRINITMDEGLLQRVDAVAASRGTTRSGYLAEAARKALRDGVGE